MIDEKAGRVSFGMALKDYLRGYVRFRGRSTRAGYWWVQLVVGIVWVALFVWLMIVAVNTMMQAGVLNSVPWGRLVAPLIVMIVFALAQLLPSLALAVLLGLNYAVAMTSVAAQYSRLDGVLAQGGLAGAGAVASSAQSGFELFLTFVSYALGIFFFVLTVLPSDVMVTKSHNGFVRFFIRAAEA